MHTLRRVVTALVAALLSLTAVGQTAEGQQRAYTKEHPLVYEDAWDLWPYVFLDDEGRPTGYNVDLLRLIFEHLDIPYVIRLKPTSQALEDLRDGHSDLMLGMVASFHDDYTLYYGKNIIHLFTHSVAHPRTEASAVHTLEDLERQTVIVHTGSFSHHLMEDHGWQDNAIGYSDMDKAIQMVSAEGHGQVLWNTMSMKWLIHRFHADNLVLTPVDMPSGDYRFMANDAHLIELLDQAYSELDAANALQPLQAKWFHPEERGAEPKGFPLWIWYIAAGAALVTLALVAINVAYRMRERSATRKTRQRNLRLTQILQNSQVKVWTYHVHTNTFHWFGDSGMSLKRYTADEFATRYTPEDYRRLTDALSQVATGQQAEVKLQLMATDGEGAEERMYNVSLSVLRREKGQPSIIIGTKADITEDYRKQQATSELTRRYQGVFNTAMVDMVYYDADGYITNMNERAQRTFQMDLADTLRERVNVRDLVGLDEFSYTKENGTVQPFHATLFLNVPQENRDIQSRKRKDVMYYELQLVPVYDTTHRMLGVYGTGREVTEVAETYHQAQQGVERLLLATKAVSDHVDNINFAMQVGGVRMVTYSPQTHLLTINHRMHEAQYVLTQQRALQLTAPASQRAVMRLLRAMDRLTPTPMDCEVQTTLRVPGGKQLCLQLHFYPTFDDEGRLQSYAGICRDTTELKHTERQLQLETEKAQEVEQVKNQFLHNMCYEIRTPLNTVVGFAEMFEQEHRPEEEEMFLREIKSNSTFLLNLINDILFLSRLDAHMVEIRPQPCDFSLTFEGHCQMGWNGKQREGVRYIVESHYSRLVVNIDDQNLGRIIEQVAANAAEHTRQGTIRARYDYIGERLIIAIDDTGEGMSPETLAHVFERFNMQQGQNKGTGLGLPIAQELATQLGGSIDINSQQGKGTTVWITVPCEATAIERNKDI